MLYCKTGRPRRLTMRRDATQNNISKTAQTYLPDGRAAFRKDREIY
jgi:hypothetical protein